MRTNTLNVSVIIRDEIRKKQPGMRISADAIQELKTRVQDRIEDISIGLCEQIQKENRMTIKETDIINYFSFHGRDVI